jgi:phosphoribosyl-ATP pyrophosphohydrolase/phosphoribosyl-AMP cyclohydrolase
MSEPAFPEPGTEAVRFGSDGLIPVVVQDAGDGRVLMVAYTDAESLAATLATGEVHFHSRTRGRLWRKGETSGHILRLRGLEVDCDGDALLAAVEPVGPTCHRQTRSCFDPAPPSANPATAAAAPAGQGFAWLERLWTTIAERAATRPEGSYTSTLIAAGVDSAGRKVTEEATEVLLAARDDAEAERGAGDRGESRAALAGEVADLLYHALVLLAERGLEPREVVAVLRARART